MSEPNIYIAACATWLPPLLPVAQAVADGQCDEKLAQRTGMVSVAVAGTEAAPEMAGRAARIALRRARYDGADIALILHANFFYQGHDVWAPASYVQRVAVGNDCPAVEIRQASNGGMAAVDLARAFLIAGPGREAALVTTGDKFSPPAFDRWRSDPGTVYADGGTALALSRRRGFGLLRSLVTVSDPELEGMHRGDDSFGPAPLSARSIVDLDACQRDFLASAGMRRVAARVCAGQEAVLTKALAQAEVELADIDRVVLPHLGLHRLNGSYLRRLGLRPEITTWPWSRHIGHLGAGDPFAGLEHLMLTGALGAGDRCLVISVGAGFTWTAAVIDILERPTWADHEARSP
ncbi:ketoacyl-ACP synthase III family protein [Actinomadura sp. NPDC023710]|uniref:ketoacyl-ACP synthase III family protein n=1 Tax=Actinomadura sp. NPDC023710 TaxID=3158219 RepID=UPI00340EEEEE